jgi:serine/threonine protein kinase
LDLFQGTLSSYAALLLNVSDVEISSDCLGEGFHSKVFLGRLQASAQHAVWQRCNAASLDDHRHVAVKVFAHIGAADDLQTHAAISAALLEARLHAQMEHPNLVRLFGAQEARQPLMLVLEYCEHGDLLNALRTRSGTPGNFSVEQRRDMIAQVSAALRYLHGKLVVHRDIAARNVLLASSRDGAAAVGPCGFVLKLSDLGLSRQLQSGQDYYSVRCVCVCGCV